MVPVKTITLQDIQDSLRARTRISAGIPCHVAAFSLWIIGDEAGLRDQVQRASGFEGQSFLPEHVATLGCGAVAGILDDDKTQALRDGIIHLAGRDYFAPGRPLRMEADGICLLGISLGAAATNAGGPWLNNLLARASSTTDLWQQGLMRAARLTTGEKGLRISPPDLAVAFAARNNLAEEQNDFEDAWDIVAQLKPHEDGVARDAVRLAIFEIAAARQSHVAIKGAGKDDLKILLQNVARSLKLWQYERKGRTSRSAPGLWEIDNEYHVQSLLWAILAPAFSDLEEEEYLPSVGHKHPRVDLAVPSLRTLIEVKFLRSVGQRACAEVIEQIAADASLYLKKPSAYDDIIAVVWDDCAQTEQYHELRTGLEAIAGISAAIVIARPAKMRRTDTSS